MALTSKCIFQLATFRPTRAASREKARMLDRLPGTEQWEWQSHCPTYAGNSIIAKKIRKRRGKYFSHRTSLRIRNGCARKKEGEKRSVVVRRPRHARKGSDSTECLRIEQKEKEEKKWPSLHHRPTSTSPFPLSVERTIVAE